ncbi:helix-turn-helix transcriptional regulator [Amycolatopsis sp. FDAARGOS 1241]|uniref:helix-turn-helix domain-containing protein n=1 Tax=Amycolatopsis sp. FDAARGOS 1241 TaxID=2778070 RepID=UPI00195050E1|nr:helix-turn-helix transcriptional regulator [Amycolatopsis sp. FDAARGOS 1241]QRP45790.1 helix-turn-helix domain-containing protein [Amycolatopsis sp. FDAARGOS 1241]
MAGTTERDTTAREREIGDELRRLRVRANLTAADLSKRVGFSPSKISRMESGARGVTEIDATLFAANCGASRKEVLHLVGLVHEADDGYRLRPHEEQLSDELPSLIVAETGSSEIIQFEPLVIPGILQIEEYARAIFRWAADFDDAAIEVRVQARLARQSLLRRKDSPYFTFYIHEEVLRAPVANRAIMHEQVLHLLLASSLDRCVVRVVPKAACPNGVLGTGFRVMRYNGQRPIIYTENQTSNLFLEKPEDIEEYRKVLARVAGFALDGADSREWLATLASEYDQAKDGPDELP